MAACSGCRSPSSLPAPRLTLLNKGVQVEDSAAPSPVQLGSPDDLPLDGRLIFFLKSTVPAKFPRNEKVELAAADGSFNTELSLADGSLMLEDAKTAMGSVEPRDPLWQFRLRAGSRTRHFGQTGLPATGFPSERWCGSPASRSCVVRTPLPSHAL